MQTYEEILAVLIELVEPFVEGGLEIKENMDLVADLDLDSLKVMDLLALVEDRFDVSIPLNILPDVRTVKDFAQQLQRLTKETV